MTAQGYGHGSMSRKRKTLIVTPRNTLITRAEARRAWEHGDPFAVLTREGAGREITRTAAIAEGIAEVTIHFGKQAISVRVI